MTEQKKAKVEPQAYKSHRPGSRKGILHELFDREGADVAFRRGTRMGLTENTLRTWISRWQPKSKTAKVSTPKVKKVAKRAKAKAEEAAPPKSNGSTEAVIVA